MFSLYISVDITLLLLYWVVQDLAMSNISLVRAFYFVFLEDPFKIYVF